MLGYSGVSLIHLTPHMDYRSFHSFKTRKKITPGNCGITAFSPRTLITSNYHHVRWCSLMATVHWSNLLLDVEGSQWVNVCDFYVHAYAQETGLTVYIYTVSSAGLLQSLHIIFLRAIYHCLLSNPPPPPPPQPMFPVIDKMQKQGLKKKKIPPPPPTKQKTLPFPVTFTFKMQK